MRDIMEEASVKLERLAPVVIDLIGKLQGFETLVTADKRTSTMREILTTVEDLRNSLKTSYTPSDTRPQAQFDDQVERIFSEFNWSVNYTIQPYEYPEFLSHSKSLLSSVMKLLGKRNCGILIVEMYFKMCIRVINELIESVEGNANVSKDVLLFQMLIKGFLSSMRVLQKFWYAIVMQEQKCSVMLCLNQSFKTLSFLGKVIEKRVTHLIVYLLNRLKQCLNKFLDLLFNPSEQFQNSEFILLMDACLNKLKQLSNHVDPLEESDNDVGSLVTDVKQLLDELLCHAMTVGHISNDEIYMKLIKSHSQKVLDGFSELAKGEDDILESTEKLSDSLCQLEEVVNTSVLNVALDVFMDINCPIRNLLQKCSTEMEGNEKSADDLEEEISHFDEHMDRIMHIGLFAISCSMDVKKILQIRSCLASLESLEAELITAVVSLYLQSNDETKTTFKFIFRNWLEEVTELKNLMDLILDPVAFCQVIEKRVTALTYEMDDVTVSLERIKGNLTKIVGYGKKLIKTLTRSLEHDDEDVKTAMKSPMENLRLAHQECDASFRILRDDVSEPATRIAERVVKRCGLLITAIIDMIRQYSRLNSSETDDEGSTSLFHVKDAMDRGFYTLNTISQDGIDVEVLTPYIDHGKRMTKERTILYATPRNAQFVQSTPGTTMDKRSWLSEEWRTRSRRDRSSRCCRPLPRRLELENTPDLELTELLESVTDLSNTFRTAYAGDDDDDDEERGGEEMMLCRGAGDEVDSMTTTATAAALTPSNDEDRIHLGTIMRQKLDKSISDLSNSSTLSIHKDSNCRYETPERLHDITMAQKRINFLMEEMVNCLDSTAADAEACTSRDYELI